MQLIAVTYHGADSSISYIAARRDSQLFQIFAPVNTNTMLNLPQSQTQTLKCHVQDKPLHLYVNLFHLSAIPFNPSSFRLEQ